MRPSFVLCLIGMCTAGSGCALVQDGSRNLCHAITAPFEIHREKARNEKWAEAAWQTLCMKEGPASYSDSFAKGFKDGFAEYLFRGGNGEPPLVAPAHYRHFRYQNANGYQAIQDWFVGFRHGASAAQDSGARKWIIGPSALPGDGHVLPTLNAHLIPGSYLPRHEDSLPERLPHESSLKISEPIQMGAAKPEPVRTLEALQRSIKYELPTPLSAQEQSNVTIEQKPVAPSTAPLATGPIIVHPQPIKIKLTEIRTAPQLEQKLEPQSTLEIINFPVQNVPEAINIKITNVRTTPLVQAGTQPSTIPDLIPSPKVAPELTAPEHGNGAGRPKAGTIRPGRHDN